MHQENKHPADFNNSAAININFPCEKPCSPFPFTNFNSKINTLSKD